MLRELMKWPRAFGLNPRKFLTAARGVSPYLRDRKDFRSRMGADFRWAAEFPILDERGESSGNLGAYFHQDLLVAGWILEDTPRRHLDVGSRVDGFIAHLAVFREVEVLDIRPQPANHKRIIFRQMDLMAELPEEWVSCTDSLSCLHTIEHFGLGRYGDTIDPSGHLKGLEQLMKMVEPGGRFYLSTPIGPQRVEFNAHRIFSAETLLGWFATGWKIERFHYLDDHEQLHEADLSPKNVAENLGCTTGLGIICARKLAAD